MAFDCLRNIVWYVEPKRVRPIIFSSADIKMQEKRENLKYFVENYKKKTM